MSKTSSTCYHYLGLQTSVSTLVLAFVFLGAAGCKKKKLVDFNRTPSAYIIGPNNIVPVDDNVTTQVSIESVHASVLIATKLRTGRVKFCSGTLILPEEGNTKLRVLSNHHCFAETDTDGKAVEKLLPEACTSTMVYFGFAPQIESETEQSPCETASLRTDFQGDLSVFTLVTNPPSAFQPVEFWDGEDAPIGRKAFIIHYPDIEDQLALPPGGKIKLPTAQATIDDCQTLGPFDVSEWDLDRTLPYALRHTCDLIHGSSGSGLIDQVTGRLLGVNWGGLKVSYEDGARIDNVATRASYVIAFLNNETEVMVHNAEVQRANSSDALGKKKSGVSKKSATLAAEVRKAACGVTFTAGSDAQNKAASLLVLLLLGFLPVVFLLKKKKS